MSIKLENISSVPESFMVALDAALKKIPNINALDAAQYSVLLHGLRDAVGFNSAGAVWSSGKAARRSNVEEHIMLHDIERAFTTAGLKVSHSNKLIAGSPLPKSESDLFKVHRCVCELLDIYTAQNLKPVYKHSNKIEVNQ